MRDQALFAALVIWAVLIIGAAALMRRRRTREIGRAFMAGLVGLSLTPKRKGKR